MKHLFTKGYIPWNKGKTGIYSQEQCKKIGDAHRGSKNYNWGRDFSKETREKMGKASMGHTPWNKGRIGVYSEETIIKMKESRAKQVFSIETLKKKSKTMKGRKPWNTGKRLSEEHRKKLSLYNLKNPIRYWSGKKFSQETRKKISDSHLKNKEKNHNWKGGIILLNEKIRKCFQYRQWRESIFRRDDYTCQKCGNRGGILNADHKKAFALIIIENNIKTIEEAIDCKEFWDVNNGRTLCEKPCHRETENYGLKAIKGYRIIKQDSAIIPVLALTT